MAELRDNLSSLWPALAFLLAGVPLAALLEKLGFFDAVAAVLARGGERETPVAALWLLAALTTIVLNLDTTIVLLTPLYLQLARRSRVDPLPIVAIPLLLASLASSVLPISNLTTLIVVARLDVGVGEVVGHLGLPSVAAATAGWLVYRRRHPTSLVLAAGSVVDVRALRIGGLVVAGLLVAFVVGPSFGVDPWIPVVVADLVLMVVTRLVPWRAIPVTTALTVLAIAVVVLLVAPTERLGRALDGVGSLGMLVTPVVAGAAANAVNNLPALLVAVDGVDRMSWGMWAWLLGVNTAAVLLPLGALANLLWLRIVRRDGIAVGLRRYVTLVAPEALTAFAAAVAVLWLEHLLFA